MYTEMYIVLFILFVNTREQLRSCEASDVKSINESQKEAITCREELLHDITFKMIEWKHKFEEKLAIIENDIRILQYSLMTNNENEKELKEELIKEFIYLQKQELENSNFNRIMIYNILCLMGKYSHTQ